MQAPIQKCRRYFGKINCRCDNRRNKYFDNTCQQAKWKGYGIGKKANYVRKNWQSISLSVAFTKPINSGQSLESGAFSPTWRNYLSDEQWKFAHGIHGTGPPSFFYCFPEVESFMVTARNPHHHHCRHHIISLYHCRCKSVP